MHGAVALIAIVTFGCKYHGAAEQDAEPQVGVGFQFATSLTDERSGTHSVSIALASPANDIVTVDIDVDGGSAQEPDDFTLITTTVTFLPGETQADVDLDIVDDGVEEGDETVVLKFGRVTNAVPIHDSHTITISANFLPRVDFVGTMSQSTEGNEAQAQVMLQKDIVSPLDCVVAIGVSGSATDGEDYTPPPATVTIPGANMMGEVDVPLLNDVFDEDDETVHLTLTAQQNCVVGTNTEYIHTIVDEDAAPFISFDSSSSSANENGGGVGLSVTVSPMSEKTVTVNYAITGGDAEGGDYNFAGGTLTFNPRDTNQSIPISPVDDGVDEDDETVTVSLSSPGNAQAGAQLSNTFSIIDDDAAPTIAWSTGSSSNNEDVGSYNLTVNKTGATERTCQFSVTSTNGSAGGGDYSVSSGPYTIGPAAAGTTVSVGISGDNIDENATETFSLGFSGLVACTAGSPGTYNGTINDDDVGASWTTAGRSLNEGMGGGSDNYDYDVTLDATSTHTITMDIGVSGSANGTDRTVSPTSLSFTPGQTLKTVTVTVNHDNTSEPNETVVLTLQNASAYVELKSPNQVTHTILNDD